jgi:hypothetical protein
MIAVVGFTLPHATAYAVAARLWFLIGESLMFLAGWGAHRGNVVHVGRTSRTRDGLR